MDYVAIIEAKHQGLTRRLDEATLRLWATTEARSLVHGDVSNVARATGMSRATIYADQAELKAVSP